MNFVYCVTTYNRLSVLKNHIETWYATINKSHTWNLFIADDGSTDGTIDYLNTLQLSGINIKCIFNKRRGIST